MSDHKQLVCVAALALLISAAAVACTHAAPDFAPSAARRYAWTRATDAAAFPVGYNFPVFVARNRMWAFHYEGVWSSSDGREWTRAALPPLGRDAYQTRYVQLGEAIYALGDSRGDYVRGIRFKPVVRRTVDLERWQTLAEDSQLPARVFYGALAYRGKLWLIGGYDGDRYTTTCGTLRTACAGRA